MIIAEIPKANYCSFFCFLLTMDECIINVWGYTEILPGKIVHYTEQLEEQILVRKTPATYPVLANVKLLNIDAIGNNSRII